MLELTQNFRKQLDVAHSEVVSTVAEENVQRIREHTEILDGTRSTVERVGQQVTTNNQTLRSTADQQLKQVNFYCRKSVKCSFRDFIFLCISDQHHFEHHFLERRGSVWIEDCYLDRAICCSGVFGRRESKPRRICRQNPNQCRLSRGIIS